MPAPPRNSNALKHGLSIGRLPKGAAYVANLTAKLRQALEDATLDIRGQVGVYELAVINSAIRWERHALLAQRWLRREAANLTPDQRLAFSREVARASSERDKCLKALGLYRTPRQDVLASFYAEPKPLPDDGTEPPVASPTEPAAESNEPPKPEIVFSLSPRPKESES